MTKETFISQMNADFEEKVAAVMQNGDVLIQYPTDTERDYTSWIYAHLNYAETLSKGSLPEMSQEDCEDGYTEVVIPAQYFN